MAFSLLHAFTVFSSFPIIIGDVLQRSAAVAIDQLVTDGGKFVKRIVHGEKITEIPGYLLFTAPLKLCEGGCKGGESNFAMAFPIYIGKKGVDKYKELYKRDYENLHPTKPFAPFKKRSTKKLFTLCPTQVTKEQTTITATAKTEPETTLIKSLTSTNYETETPATESQNTLEGVATTMIETPINFPKTTTPSDFDTETNTTPRAKTEIKVFKILSKAPKNPTVTVGSTESYYMAETDELTTNINKSIINYNHLPVHIPLHTGVAYKKTTKTIVKNPNAKITTIFKLEFNANTDTQTDMFITETPKFTDTEITETEDITFESSEYDYNKNNEDEEYNYVTNAKGLRCPLRICKKKKKVTAAIVLLKGKKEDSRNAQWNSDYSDFSDLLYSRDFSK